jgi:hypothetical protein
MAQTQALSDIAHIFIQNGPVLDLSTPKDRQGFCNGSFDGWWPVAADRGITLDKTGWMAGCDLAALSARQRGFAK